MPLDEVGWKIDFSSSWNEILAQPIVMQSRPRQQPTGGIQTHNFVDDLFGIDKRGQVIEFEGGNSG